MLYKIAVRNMRKSMKDYTIYFITLILGVSVFYMFNCISGLDIIRNFGNAIGDKSMADNMDKAASAMDIMMNYVSVFVAVILGLLIVYANSFLIRRRKKEFGVYLTLGMSKLQVSEIILIETLSVGLISLVAGMILGVFLSQFVSVLIAQAFVDNTTQYSFIFSLSALTKTWIYFAGMYIFTLFTNTIAVSQIKLIDLLTSAKKAESDKINKPIVSVIGFIISVGTLLYCYIMLVSNYNTIVNTPHAAAVFLGVIPPLVLGTLLLFWSISGFMLWLLRANKKIYLRGTNMFVIKQLGSKIHSTVVSMGLITLMLTIMITTISASCSVSGALRVQLNTNFPVDIVINRFSYFDSEYMNENKDESVKSYESIASVMRKCGFDMSLLSEYVEVKLYIPENIFERDFIDKDDFEYLKGSGDITYRDENGNYYEYDSYFDNPIRIIKMSDYNRLAGLYGKERIKIEDDQYTFICNVAGYASVYGKKLSDGKTLKIGDKTFKPGADRCTDSLIYPDFFPSNTGVIVISDNAILDENTASSLLAANYNTEKMDRKSINRIFNGGTDTEGDVIIEYKPNEYSENWDKVSSYYRINVQEDPTAHMLEIYDENGDVAAYKDKDGNFWHYDESGESLVQYKDGEFNMKDYIQYNYTHLYQTSYIEGYTEHLNENGVPVAYEDENGKFWYKESVVDENGYLTEEKMTRFKDGEFAPEIDYIYDHENEEVYMINPDGSKTPYEVPEEMDFFNSSSEEVEDELPCLFWYGQNSRIDGPELAINSFSTILFLALYIGSVFMLASAAVLGLKQLSEAADSKERYAVLRKIGCDEKIINKSLFRQILFFFTLPLAVALLHSAFLLNLVLRFMEWFVVGSTMLLFIILTIAIIAVVYLAYFIATYYGSKAIIRDSR